MNFIRRLLGKIPRRSYRDTVLADNPIAYYRLGEAKEPFRDEAGDPFKTKTVYDRVLTREEIEEHYHDTIGQPVPSPAEMWTKAIGGSWHLITVVHHDGQVIPYVDGVKYVKEGE